MATVPKPRYTVEEYLALERRTETRHEFYAGEIFAMGGASEAHVLVVTNAVMRLALQLSGRPCKVYSNDMRVRIARTGLYTYPDIAVVCGEARFDDDQFDTLLNPKLIVEVLSESTERYDRGKKFEHYRKIESLTDYVLIAQDAPHIEHYERHADGWLLTEADDLAASIAIPSIACELRLAEVYDKVELGSGEVSA
jgi:Uma2 family endonuclease